MLVLLNLSIGMDTQEGDDIPVFIPYRDVPQLPVVATLVPQLHAGLTIALGLSVAIRLAPEQIIPIQQAEAALGPPRSLHKLARAALDAICNGPGTDTVDLDHYFPWQQYVAAHRQNREIIGTGITDARGVFMPDTSDANRGGAQRMDFCFYRSDGTVCRLHPGKKRNNDAIVRFDPVAVNPTA